MSSHSAEQLALTGLASKTAASPGAIELSLTGLAVALLERGETLDLTTTYQDLARVIPNGLQAINLLPLIEMFCFVRLQGVDHNCAVGGFAATIESMIEAATDPADELRDRLALQLLEPRCNESGEPLRQRVLALCLMLATQRIIVPASDLCEDIRKALPRALHKIDIAAALRIYGQLRLRGLEHRETITFLRDKLKEEVRASRAAEQQRKAEARAVRAALRSGRSISISVDAILKSVNRTLP